MKLKEIPRGIVFISLPGSPVQEGLKKEMKSIFDLSNFMIAGYPDKFSIETGGSSYKDMEDTSLRKRIQALLNG